MPTSLIVLRLATALTIVVLALLRPSAVVAQVPDTAEGIFKTWCARCHDTDGTGTVEQPTIKTRPLDFTNCSVATAEPDIDWELVIIHGGPTMGLSAEMPAFGAALRPGPGARPRLLHAGLLSGAWMAVGQPQSAARARGREGVSRE